MKRRSRCGSRSGRPASSLFPGYVPTIDCLSRLGEAMINDSAKCPLCGGVPNQAGYERDRDLFAAECERCGRFKITDEALIALQPEQKYLLSAFCRRARHGNSFVTILSNNISQLVDSLPKYSPPEKMDNLLDLIAEMTVGPGEVSQFHNERDYPLLIARDRGEVDYFARELVHRNYLDGARGYALTMRGWERLEEIKKRAMRLLGALLRCGSTIRCARSTTGQSSRRSPPRGTKRFE